MGDCQRERSIRVLLIAGTVGTGPATEFASFREIWQQMVSVDQILSDPEGAPDAIRETD